MSNQKINKIVETLLNRTRKQKIHTQYLPSTSTTNVGNYQLEDLCKEYQIIVKYLL